MTGVTIAQIGDDTAVVVASSGDNVTVVQGVEAAGPPGAAGSLTGTAGGDLTGTYPNPTIGTGKVTSTHILDGTIVNGDISASAAIALSKLATDPLARANHTGTQTASTISDFDTQVATTAVVKSLVDAKGDLIAATADNTVARVAVGANGKTLHADSTASAGVAWDYAIPPFGDAKDSGGTVRYTIPGWLGVGVGTVGLAANTRYYFPVYLPTPATCDQIAIEQTAAGAAGKLFRIGLIAADKWWQPTGSALIDSGTFAADGANGVKTYAPGSPVALAPGRYLSILMSDGSPTVRTTNGTTIGAAAMNATIGANPLSTAWRRASSFGAVDTTAWSTDTVGPAFASAVFFRFSDPAP